MLQGTFIWSVLNTHFKMRWTSPWKGSFLCADSKGRWWWLVLYSHLLGRSLHLVRYMPRERLKKLHLLNSSEADHSANLIMAWRTFKQRQFCFQWALLSSREKQELTAVGWSQTHAKKIQSKVFCTMSETNHCQTVARDEAASCLWQPLMPFWKTCSDQCFFPLNKG